MEKDNKTTFTITIEKEKLKKLRLICIHKDISVSEEFRLFIEQTILEYEIGIEKKHNPDDAKL